MGRSRLQLEASLPIAQPAEYCLQYLESLGVAERLPFQIALQRVPNVAERRTCLMALLQ
jgi:hypothetical protein